MPYKKKEQKLQLCNMCKVTWFNVPKNPGKKEYVKKTCGLSCSSRYSAKKARDKYIKEWKLGLKSGMKGKQSISGHIRKYLFHKYDNKCMKCGWNEVHSLTGLIPLQIDHIDGDFKNNKEENLRLLCPNCHSLTHTYGSLNIGNGRRSRTK